MSAPPLGIGCSDLHNVARPPTALRHRKSPGWDKSPESNNLNSHSGMFRKPLTNSGVPQAQRCHLQDHLNGPEQTLSVIRTSYQPEALCSGDSHILFRMSGKSLRHSGANKQGHLSVSPYLPLAASF